MATACYINIEIYKLQYKWPSQFFLVVVDFLVIIYTVRKGNYLTIDIKFCQWISRGWGTLTALSNTEHLRKPFSSPKLLFKKGQAYTVHSLNEFRGTANMLNSRYLHSICRPMLKRGLLLGAEAVGWFFFVPRIKVFSSYF